MNSTAPQPGYTLPVFAVAAAQAALLHLLDPDPDRAEVRVGLDLEDRDTEMARIPIEQVAQLDQHTALAMCRSDPGPNLDLTRHTPIWAWVQLEPAQDPLPDLDLQGGEGIGRTPTGEAAIYRYARKLFEQTLHPLIPAGSRLVVRIILPQGRQLAQRTSNAAFGVLEGLALLGTRGTVEPHSAVASLETSRAALQAIASRSPALTLCIGSHGQQVAQRLGIPVAEQVVAGNWIGALLVEAALLGVGRITLLGYHGKLIKLAGGIFNTSSHLADGRLEILSAAVIRSGGSIELARSVLESATVDAASQVLQQQQLDSTIWRQVVSRIQAQAGRYVKKYADQTVEMDVILFDRTGLIVARSGS